jgi:2,3-bisphosphoglycerate-independent phosphoglycerate mutase
LYEHLLEHIARPNDAKIVLIVMDGLGGLPSTATGRTELEEARKTEIDRLAQRSALGLVDPIAPGITPGSGPAHLGIFGYDPIKWDIGRGILSALGIGFPVEPADLTARGNYATVDRNGMVVDRRAGRIPTEINQEISGSLDGMKIEGATVYVRAEKEHRVAVIFRGEGLSQDLTDSDPQVTGRPALTVEATEPAAAPTARLVNAFLAEVARRIGSRQQANTILLRGFAKHPTLPAFAARYKMRACAIASYPMYKGLARLVGMTVVDGLDSLEAELDALEKAWPDYDFFYFHYKKTDSKGEDGDFQGKVQAIEEFDSCIPRILGLSPDVVALTGDHSTPSLLKMHSWHPVPLALWSRWVIPDGLAFSERSCARGNLGRLRSIEVLPLLMANARKLDKYGA